MNPVASNIVNLIHRNAELIHFGSKMIFCDEKQQLTDLEYRNPCSQENESPRNITYEMRNVSLR